LYLDKRKTEVVKDGTESVLVFVLWLAASFFEQSSGKGNLLACLYDPLCLFLFDGSNYLKCHPLDFAERGHAAVVDQKHVF
jgi:hypothetical protein